MGLEVTVKEFFEAIQNGDRERVEALLAADPPLVDARNEDGSTAVQSAVYSFQRPLADLLVDRGATLDLPSACCVGAIERIEALSSAGDPNQLAPDGFAPLALAAAFGGPESVSVLLKNGANVDLRSKALGGVAAIHAAVFGRQAESLRLLLRAGADPNLVQEGGFTALMGAAQNGNEEMIADLLQACADRGALSKDGKSAGDYALESGHARCAAMLSEPPDQQ